MTKRLRIVTTVLVVIVASLIVPWLTREPEPVYQGKPLSVWLEGYTLPRTQAAWQKTDEAVRQIGPKAIPWLLKMLRLSDSPLWKRTFFDLAYRQHFIKVRHINAWAQNWRAALALGAMGSQAEAAVPELIQLSERPISGPSRRYTLMALGKIGPAAKKAVPSLLGTLTTSADDEARAYAAFALGGIHAEPEHVVPALIKSLADSSSEVQTMAAEGLGNFAAEAKAAIPALVILLKSPNKDLADHAKAALLQIDPATQW